MTYPRPLLELRDIGKLVKSGNHQTMAVPGYKYCNWFSRGAAALGALCLYNQSKGLPIRVLLPGYYCGESLGYLRAQSVEFSFYSLNEDYSPDYNSIRKTYGSQKFDYFIHVHYFGNLINPKESLKFARESGASLIEDCAHIISPLTNKAWVGDYLLFSPYKFFTLPQIGVIFSNKEIQSPNREYSISGRSTWVLKELIKRASSKLSISRAGSPWGLSWSTQSLANWEKPIDSSVVSMATGYMNDFEKISNTRRLLARRLSSMLEIIPAWKLIFSEWNESTPYIVGVCCDNTDTAIRRFELLNARKKLVLQWPDLPIELIGNLTLKNHTVELVNRTLFFNLHHQLEADSWLENIRRICMNDNF